MREVLISIQPRWVEKIVIGAKTVEVRRTRPKCETPFKCYIYCTKDNTFAEKTLRGFDDNGKALYYKANKGKVIGEFVCDDIDTIAVFNDRLYCVKNSQANKLTQMCLTIEEIKTYLGSENQGYNWHISDLVIYDKPRELSEFRTPCKMTEGSCYFCDYAVHGMDGDLIDCNTSLERPPQSWCYVESEARNDNS